MMEGVNGTPERLVEKKIIQIACSSFSIDSPKPQCAEQDQDQPGSPAPYPREEPKTIFARARVKEKNEHGCRKQRYEEAQRSLGEDSEEDEQREKQSMNDRYSFVQPCRVHCPRFTERQDDEQAHQHVHADSQGTNKKEPAGDRHQTSQVVTVSIHLVLCPRIYSLHNPQSRHKREERQQPHVMATGQPATQHDDPQIEGWLVSVWYPVVCEEEKRVVTQRLVSDAEITELIARCKVTQKHHRQHGQDDAYI